MHLLAERFVYLGGDNRGLLERGSQELFNNDTNVAS